MKRFRAVVAFLFVAAASASALAQQTPDRPVTATTQSPTLVRLDGQLVAPTGEPRTGTVTVAVSLYGQRDDTVPLWVEQQNVTLGPGGRYTVYAGATLPDGVPQELLTGGSTGHWIGVGVQGEPEQYRTLLLTVPYAARAREADSLSGKKLTDFVQTSDLAESVKATLKETSKGTVHSGGATTNAGDPGVALTDNFLHKSASGGTVTVDSQVFDNGTNIGIGTTTPNAKFEVRTNAGIAARALDILNTGAGGGEFVVNVFSGALGSLVAGDALMSNGVGNLLFSPNAAGKDVRFVGGVWTNPIAMTVKDGGNVGIGTTTPGAKLEVRGTGIVPRVLDLINSDPGAGEFTVNLAGGAIASLVAGDALISNGVGNIVFSPNAAGKDIRFVPGVWVNAPALVMKDGGNVGIGTLSPAAKLHVAGNAQVDGNIAAKYQDVAEWVETTEPLEPGTLVIVDPAQANRVRLASVAYDTRVAGAVSAKPGLILGEQSEGKAMVAQSGRVRVKADATYGAIRIGDLLVASATPGYVMRSKPIRMGGQTMHRPGTIVGKALEALPNGKGEILVLLTLQ